jgi:ligand-binding SRPBCC domain-containing protein
MPVIKLITIISAPIERCFDLSSSIDLHKMSTAKTNEIAIAGTTSGLINKDEFVIWQARHFGITQQLTTVITEMKSPTYFVDEMKKGTFKKFKHEHLFEFKNGITQMTDIFDYTSPFGIIGKVADFVFLKNYMSKFLTHRNEIIKDFAESNKWQQVL